MGNAYVTGSTSSWETTFPVKTGPDLTHNGLEGAFIARIVTTHLTLAGTPRPGGRVTFGILDDPSTRFQLGSALSKGPVQIGKRQLGLGPDGLMVISVSGLWPWVFVGYQGLTDSKGQALAAIHLPNNPALIGTRIHTAFVTLDPTAPSGIKSISNTESFTITK